MALTIKNPETLSLAKALAGRTGLTQTAAITLALRQSLDAGEAASRQRRAREVLERIWREAPPGEAAVISQAADALYGADGLPS